MSLPFIIVPTIMRDQGETGVQTYFNSIADYLCSKGIGNCIATPFLHPKWIILPIFGIRRIIDPFSGSLSVWWYRYWHYLILKQVLKKELASLDTQDVVFFAQCPLSAKAALEVRTTKKQKVIMVVHFNVSQADEWMGKGKIKNNSWIYHQIKALESEVIPQVDKIIYVSAFMKKLVEANISEAAFIESAILPSFVVYPKTVPNKAVEGDLISIGTLETRKNHQYLLLVLAEAKKLGKCYSLTLVGDGPQRENLEKLAQDLDVYSQVTFTGFQANAASYLPYHRVYVHSASLDNRPISILEALACSLPILAPSVGGIPECFSDGAEGFYWSLDNPKMGAQKLIELLENPDTYSSMKQAAKNKFDTTFSCEEIGPKLLQHLVAYPDLA
ncbi:glycosyltransferase family 4 protein [Leptolyngbya ohadii]|uniref:glycosyltransferase family 4 protein n=1 Tax=Leptolyngbya ohadii TaxID=1962290 RepID=UPI000B59C0D5|nr:glycosyltransferase [Leptolyngbya ohadii]